MIYIKTQDGLGIYKVENIKCIAINNSLIPKEFIKDFKSFVIYGMLNDNQITLGMYDSSLECKKVIDEIYKNIVCGKNYYEMK